MAILKSVPGIEVSICIDKKPLTEYDNTDEAEFNPAGWADDDIEVGRDQHSKTVSKFIMSTAGEFFSIKCSMDPESYKFTDPCNSLGCEAFVDGESVNHYPLLIIEDPENYIQGNFSQSSLGLQVQKLRFVKICTTDDESKLITERDMKSIGLIEVHVYRQTCSEEGTFPEDMAVIANEEDNIHEKSLKGEAKSHITSFGDIEPCDKDENFRDAEFCDDDPIAIFKFRYGAKEDLQALGVIERDPEPDDDPTPGDPAPQPEIVAALAALPASLSGLVPQNMDPARISQLFGQFLQYLQTEENGQEGMVAGNGALPTPNPPIKQEPSTTPAPPIKQEPEDDNGPARKKRRKLPGKMIVDLTEDSDHEDAITLE